VGKLSGVYAEDVPGVQTLNTFHRLSSHTERIPSQSRSCPLGLGLPAQPACDHARDDVLDIRLSLSLSALVRKPRVFTTARHLSEHQLLCQPVHFPQLQSPRCFVWYARLQALPSC